MKIELNSTKLKKSFQTIQTILGEQNVFISAGSDKFYAEASNGAIYLKLIISDVTVKEAGFAAITSKYVTNLKLNESVKLEAQNNKLKFFSGNIKGSIDLNQDTSSINTFRPSKEIPVAVRLPKVVLDRAIQKTGLSNALVASNDGLRLHFDEYITATATDEFRATLYKDQLPFAVKNLSVIVNPSLIGQIVSKIDDPEIGVGVENDIVHIKSLSMDCYIPSIQIEIQDVEEWVSSIDQDTKICSVSTEVEKLHKLVVATSSIVTEKVTDSSVSLSLSIKGKELDMKVVSSHGEADATMTLDDVTGMEEHNVCLSNKYTTEMLHLLKSGKITIDFFENYVIVITEDGKSIYVMPVVAD